MLSLLHRGAFKQLVCMTNTYLSSVISINVSFLTIHYSSDPGDFLALPQNLTFSPGDVIQFSPIFVVNDGVVEDPELFSLLLNSTDPSANIISNSEVLIASDGDSKCFVL